MLCNLDERSDKAVISVIVTTFGYEPMRKLILWRA
jgi:hypothetical protein